MASQKFYAVRVGRKTGVYNDWNQAKTQVVKFKGAVYQSFDNPKTAWEFVRSSEQEFKLKFIKINQGKNSWNAESDSDSGAIAYTDGSFDVATQTYSYGVVILWKNKIIKMSQRFKENRDVELRNVAGELAGAMRAMKFAKTNQIAFLTLHHDYRGIAAWANGQWKTNLPLTKEYKEYVASLQSDLTIKFVWVKGHSGDYYNEMVDELARQANFKEYRKVEKNA